MEDTGTAALRSAATDWTLAGDKQLLDILQNIHQSLMTRCQDVNRKLDEMVTTLDDASVDLQNVNNKFMALSNSQFIESRVYDDDADVTVQEPVKESPKAPDPSSELSQLKDSIKVLESMHEVIQILDSDSESDTEDDDVTRTILKPKDAYDHRPLPFIIGSQPWRAKWHAGLLPEEDSDSSVSKPGDDEEYSDSEEDIKEEESRLRVPDLHDSTTSSDITYDQDLTPAVVKPSPSDVAAELARRLRGSSPKIPDPEPDFSQVKSTKVYRPEQPNTGTIFSDEPPPLDQYQSEEESEEDDDIFAELHKNKPYTNNNKQHSRLADDLFSGLSESRTDRSEKDMFSDFNDNKPTQHIANQKSTLFEEESEPELFADKPTDKTTATADIVETNSDTTKKPVGGISLFGSNKGAESIGAAILRRNQRKSSSDEDNSREEVPKVVKNEKSPVRTIQKDLFDDLFAKSEKANKVVDKIESEVITNKKNSNKNQKKVDLFSDNLFDDIDDIFTSNVTKVSSSTNKNKKSIFDDGDDLFAEITAPTTSKPVKVEDKKRSNLFDSDDDLFSEKKEKAVTKTSKPELKEPEKETQSIMKSNTSNRSEISKVSKSIFDDDSSDSDIFSKLSETKTNGTKNNASFKDIKPESIDSYKKKDAVTKSSISHNNLIKNKESVKVNVVSIFDEEDTDIFSSNEVTTNANKDMNSSEEFAKSTATDENKTSKPSTITAFDDEDDDKNIFASLSTTSSKVKKKCDETAVGIHKKLPKVEEKSTFLGKIESEDTVNTTPKELIDNQDITRKIDSSLDRNNSNVENETKSEDFVKNDEKSLKQNEEITSISFNKIETNLYKEVTTSKLKENDINTNIGTHFQKDQTKSNDIFDDDVRDDLFDSNKRINTTDPIQQENLDFNIAEKIPKLPESDFNVTDIDNHIEKESLFSSTEESTHNIFGDILDEPPAFEKPKEPKRSKNVNALFDDDSDDEALFFKKNDGILDEKPDFSTDNINDALFGIFHDEPPAIDVDFTQKPENINATQTADLDDDLFNTPTTREIKSKQSDTNTFKEILNKNDIKKTDFDDLFNDNDFRSNTESYIPKSTADNTSKLTKANTNTDNVPNSDSDSDLFKAPKPVIKLKPNQNETKDHSNDTHENRVQKSESVTSKINNISKIEPQDTPDSPSKKVGKLKSMNFNINVNTLLPGASPKKKHIEQTDGPVLSTKSQEDLHSNDKIEPVMVKSVSFEGDPDSQILDNKISKERAKIQVKRRPSTRRARKEAVRISAIDFGEDSTDNSSSVDDISKPPRGLNKTELNAEENKVDIKSDFESKKEKSANDYETTNDFEPHAESNKEANTTTAGEVNNETETVYEQSVTTDANSLKDDTKNVKSKIVYILHDEDIFNTNIEKPVESKKPLTIPDDGDDLFRSLASSSKEKTITTLGNVYKEVTKTPTNSETTKKKSLFDDLSEDENELFNTAKKIVTKAKSILDSDSEEDLFGGKKETKHKVVTKESKDVKPKVKVKASLFSDDEDDLFGIKVKTDSVGTSQTAKTTRDIVTKPPEPVFDDPLSLLGADED